MKHELDFMDLESVTGGTVIISEDNRHIGFSSTREIYTYTCSFDKAYETYRALLKENRDKTNAEFDKIVKEYFIKEKLVDVNSRIVK